MPDDTRLLAPQSSVRLAHRGSGRHRRFSSGFELYMPPKKKIQAGKSQDLEGHFWVPFFELMRSAVRKLGLNLNPRGRYLIKMVANGSWSDRVRFYFFEDESGNAETMGLLRTTFQDRIILRNEAQN